MSLTIKKIQTDNAPQAVGPYSQSLVVGDLVFCSGQIGVDPTTNNLVEGGVLKQAERVLKNLEQVLLASNSGLSHVIKTEIFVTDISKFTEINNLYAQIFNCEPLPARVTVEVSNLPKGAEIEMSCIAVIKN